MEGNLVEGTNQPGEPRLARLRGRGYEIMAENPRGNRTHEGRLDRVEELRDVTQLCLWPRENRSIQNIWYDVRRTLTAEEVSHIRKILRVRQRNNVMRFDIFVDDASVAHILARLSRVKDWMKWWVRMHINYWNRAQRVGNQGQGDVIREMPTGSIRIASWNINGISTKRLEVEVYLEQNKVKILCLQETRRNVNHWPIRFRNYQVFESLAGSEVEHQRGLAILVHKDLVAYEVGRPSPYTQRVKVLLGNDEWTIVNVYCPSHDTNGAKAVIKREIRESISNVLGSRVLVMGDWNCKLEKFTRRIGRWRLQAQLVPGSGNMATYHARNVWSAIDHMIASHDAMPSLTKARVNRSWDLSDHWPLEVAIKGIGYDNHNGQHIVALRMDASKLQTKREDIRNSNYWDVLRESLLDEEDVEVVATRFEETVQTVATEQEVMAEAVDPNSVKKSYRLSRKAKLLIHRRRVAYSKWVQREAPRREEYYDAYIVSRQRANEEKQLCSKKSWLRFIIKGSKALTDNDMKGFWKWAKMVTNRGKTGPSDLGPLYKIGNRNQLVYRPEDKLEQLKIHYEALLRDVTGHSRDAEYWRTKLPGELAPPLQGINEDISWHEVNVALKSLKRGKAPGKDGIIPEFYKLAIDSEEGEFPTSALGRVIFEVLTRVWNLGVVPERWNEAWVVAILKDGDPKDLNNYRGISLIVVILKVLTLVVTRRIRDALESRNWFIPQQAGFRTREECAGHICSLHEMLTRRTIMGERTYVAFVDITKAYDTVPIEALFRKMELIGLSGKVLTYFRSLYSNSTVRVRTRHGLSPRVLQSRGLRQGCNASPILFDIFINDIIDGCRRLGVQLLGFDRNHREVGLLFADDLALICGNRNNLYRALLLIQRWADLFEMSFGVKECGSKCAIMGVGEGAIERLRRDPNRWQLSGRVIPIVDSYKYLGVIFRSDLDLQSMANAREDKGRKVLNTFRAVLASYDIPLYIRARVVQSILLPVLTYGSELWGMSSERCEGPQKVLSEALRLLLRISAKSSITSPATIGYELNIPPIHAIASSARARAYLKFPSLRTIIADLLRHPPVCRKRTWVTGTKQWLSRFCRVALQLSPSAGHALVKKTVWDLLLNKTSRTLSKYIANDYARTREYLAAAVRYPVFSQGIHWLCRMRVGAIWTVRRFVRIRWLPERYLTECPFCGVINDTGEDLQHLLIQCQAWAEYRLEANLGLVGDYEILLGGSRNIGEAGMDRVVNEGWMDPPDDDLNPELHAQMGDDDVDGIDVELVPMFIKVAKFLGIMMPVRHRRLSNLLRDTPRANADLAGMAVFVDADNQPGDEV